MNGIIKKYRPANGTEGMVFQEKFCFNCKKFNDCEIFYLAEDYTIDEPQYPKELQYIDGKPSCTEFIKDE